MCGVDHFDQPREYHSLSRKSRKWWLRIFYFFLDCSLVNSYILYHLSNNGTADNLRFQIMLSRQLLNGYSGRKRAATHAPGRPSKVTGKTFGVPDEVRLSAVPHFPRGTATFKCCRCCSSKQNDEVEDCLLYVQCSPCAAPCFREIPPEVGLCQRPIRKYIPTLIIFILRHIRKLLI